MVALVLFSVTCGLLLVLAVLLGYVLLLRHRIRRLRRTGNN